VLPKKWNSNIFLQRNLSQHKTAKKEPKGQTNEFFKANQSEMKPKKGQKAK